MGNKFERQIVLSVGGSLINRKNRDNNEALDEKFLHQLTRFVHFCHELNTQVFIVTGGGVLARALISNAMKQGKPSNVLDELGIGATLLNANHTANFISSHDSRITTSFVPKFNFKHINKYQSNVVVTGGTSPGHTTDYVAVQIAQKLGLTEMINLSTTPYIYEPHRNGQPNFSLPITSITWDRYFDMFRMKLNYKPGMNFPIDPEAAKLANHYNIGVVNLGGRDFRNFRSYIAQKNFNGTRIVPNPVK